MHLEHLECSYQPHIQGRGGELRSAPSGPDDWHRVAGKRALAPGVRSCLSNPPMRDASRKDADSCSNAAPCIFETAALASDVD